MTETPRRRRPGELQPLPASLSPQRAALALALRQGRDDAGLSLSELAELTYSSKASVSRWLNGGSIPDRRQMAAWATACGTPMRVLEPLWTAATAPDAGPAAPVGELPRARALWAAWSRQRAVVAAVAVVTLAGGGAAASLAARGGPAGAVPSAAALPSGAPSSGAPSAASTCPEPHLTVPPDAREAFDIVVDPGCPPAAGRQRWIMVQVDDVGHDFHTLYYLKWRIDYPAVPYRIHSTPANVGVPRTYFVIEVTDRQHTEIIGQRQTADGGLFELPGVAVVSNRAPNTRTRR